MAIELFNKLQTKRARITKSMIPTGCKANQFLAELFELMENDKVIEELSIQLFHAPNEKELLNLSQMLGRNKTLESLTVYYSYYYFNTKSLAILSTGLASNLTLERLEFFRSLDSLDNIKNVRNVLPLPNPFLDLNCTIARGHETFESNYKKWSKKLLNIGTELLLGSRALLMLDLPKDIAIMIFRELDDGLLKNDLSIVCQILLDRSWIGVFPTLGRKFSFQSLIRLCHRLYCQSPTS